MNLFIPTSFLILVHLLSTTNSLLKLDNCLSQASCKTAVEVLSRNRNESLHKKLLCFCDADCSIVNDCCEDAVPERSQRPVGIPANYWSCRELAVRNRSSQMIYMVSVCPNGHPLQESCTRSLKNYDYKLDIPVLSSLHGVWFQNIFCAMCHNHMQYLLNFELVFSCDGEDVGLETVVATGTYLQGMLAWRYEEFHCYLQPQLPISNETESWERPCYPAVQTCPSDWTNIPVATLCQSYARYVKPFQESSGLQVYKNEYCGLCHGLKVKELVCADEDIVPINFGASYRHPASLQLILRIPWNVRSMPCQAPGVWDAIHSQCWTPYPKSLGKQRSSGYGDTNVSHPCPRTMLQPKEFALLENGSLQVLISDGYVVDIGKYRLMPDGRSEVCILPHINLVSMDEVQGYLTTVCLSISVTCLVLHLIIYRLLPVLQNHHGKNLQALAIALLVAQLGFVIGVNPAFHVIQPLCIAIAGIVLYSYLSSFFWMNIISFDIWATFSTAIGHSRQRFNEHYKYAVLGWGIPGIMTTFALVMDLTDIFSENVKPGFGKRGICWFGNKLGLNLFLVVPVACIMSVNFILFVEIVYQLLLKKQNSRYIRSVQANPRQQSRQQVPPDHIRFIIFVKLFTIMGLGWIVGILAMLLNQPILWYPYIILNGLQGTFIFVMFDMKPNILAMLQRRLSHQSASGTITSSSQTPSTDV